MKIRDSFFVIGLLVSTGVLQGAQAEDDDPFGLADFNDEVDVLCAQVAEAAIAAEEASVLAAQVELVRPQLSTEEQKWLNKELLRVVEQEGREGIVARVQNLIAQGADVTAQDKFGWIPLHHVVCRQIIPELVKVLIGANSGSVNYQTDLGSTPLHLVIWHGQNESIIKAFLDASADLDIPNDRGETSRQLIKKYELEHLLSKLPRSGVRTKPAILRK